jgi:excisionase family DNA binding protein
MPRDTRSSPHYHGNTEPMMTYQEAAELMVISPRTLQRAATVGDLAVVRIGHRTVRIRREDLDAWITSKYSHSSEEG